jgi:AcrR family transcriptional regulator
MVAPHKNIGREKWLETGYRHFAEYGPEKLSINKLSKELNSSRASFYHYFGDIDVFTDQLLTMHWQIVLDFNQRGKNECTQLFPELHELLAGYPVPLSFSIQLFRHRNHPAYNYLFIKTYESSARAFILKLFAEEYNLNQPEGEMLKLWLTVGETWYSRLDLNDLSASTMQKYAEEIMDTVVSFARSHLFEQLG